MKNEKKKRGVFFLGFVFFDISFCALHWQLATRQAAWVGFLQKSAFQRVFQGTSVVKTRAALKIIAVRAHPLRAHPLLSARLTFLSNFSDRFPSPLSGRCQSPGKSPWNSKSCSTSLLNNWGSEHSQRLLAHHCPLDLSQLYPQFCHCILQSPLSP